MCIHQNSAIAVLDRCKYFMNRQQNALYNVECSWLILVIKIRKLSLGIQALGIQFIVNVSAWSQIMEKNSVTLPASVVSIIHLDGCTPYRMIPSEAWTDCRYK